MRSFRRLNLAVIVSSSDRTCAAFEVRRYALSTSSCVMVWPLTMAHALAGGGGGTAGEGGGELFDRQPAENTRRTTHGRSTVRCGFDICMYCNGPRNVRVGRITGTAFVTVCAEVVDRGGGESAQDRFVRTQMTRPQALASFRPQIATRHIRCSTESDPRLLLA